MGLKLPIRFVVCILISLFSIELFAQDPNQHIKEKFLDERGKPSLIIFNDKSVYKNTDSQNVFREQLGLKDNSSFIRIKSENDKKGFLHEKFQQYYQGIKVEFATYSLHSKSGRLESISGEYYSLEGVKIQPTLSKNEAFNKALENIGAKSYLWDSPADAAIIAYKRPVGELVLLPVVDEDANGNIIEEIHLAYKFDIYATNPISRGDIYIDATSGESLFYNAIIKHLGEHSHAIRKNQTSIVENQKKSNIFSAGNAETRYSGNQSIETSLKVGKFVLLDGSRGSGVNTYNLKNGTNYNNAVDFEDGDNNWTAVEYDNSKKDNGALDAHWGAEMTYDYWKNVHDRNSYNNSGASIRSYVHYSSNYDNAFWNGSVMTYGDGSGTYFDILTSLDVAGHEIGHAVCTYTANLAYQKESGALNESLSDIWGACVEYYATQGQGKDTWLIGEDIERRFGHAALRSMSNPKSEGQPDTYEGAYWVSQKRCRPSNINDYCGVHTNSGVLNHWFYILTAGKSGTNDKGDTYNVNGIGIDKAAQITFAMENYMNSNSTYTSARTYGIQAAKDLYGAYSAEEIAVTNAFYAVGVGAAYSGPTDSTPPSAPSNLTAAETTDTSTRLSWDAATDNFEVTAYNLYRNGNLLIAVTGLTYVVNDLSPETNYDFYVKAKDAAGNLSNASNSLTIKTSAAIPDNDPPSAPSNLVGVATNSSVALSWDASSDNVAVKEYEVYQDGTKVATVNELAYNVSGLEAKTSYSFKVIAYDKAGNSSDDSNVLEISTLAASYCSSDGTDARFERIANVQVGTFSNPSTSSVGYEDFTSKIINVTPGITYNLAITPYWSKRKYKEGYSVWIDYNGDGDFLDSGEQVFTSPLTSSSPIVGSITINSPTEGVTSTKMRVSMKYNGMPDSCETFPYGQVEDYTINFNSSVATITQNDISTVTGEDFMLYPNPSNETLNLVPAKEGLNTYKIFDINGFEVQNGDILNPINVSKLSKGMYFFEFNNGKNKIVKTFIKN